LGSPRTKKAKEFDKRSKPSILTISETFQERTIYSDRRIIAPGLFNSVAFIIEFREFLEL